jgi:uncharacterized protein (DUF2141 family)
MSNEINCSIHRKSCLGQEWLEGYGASNNPEKRMGPPDPSEAKFTLNQQKTTIEIKLIYW